MRVSSQPERSLILECYIFLAIPLVVDSDACSERCVRDGAAMKGSSVTQVLECGGEILVLAALRMNVYIVTKLMSEMGDAVEGSLRQVHALVIQLMHRGEFFHRLFFATGKGQGYRKA